jgi:fumarate reductase subunit C
MSTPVQQPRYTEFHPRWYRKRVSTWWWMGQWKYFKFILREISSIAVALSVALLLGQLAALRSGPEAYARFEARMRSPWMIVIALVLLAFTIFHSITWFNLTPRAMPAVRLGGKRVPELAIALPNFVAWFVVSVFIAWVVLRS